MFFLDAAHGWALGNAPCAAKAKVCATLLKTVDGGGHWTTISVPTGLVPVDDGDGVPNAGSCSTNGARLGPCIDNVLFTDEAHGYAWSHNFFYWTTDGGASWRDGHSRADDVVRIGNDVVRARPVADCSTCLYRIERAAIGSNNWLDVTPGHRDRRGVSLLAAGDILYASAGTVAGGPGGLYRSSDLGATWQPITWPCGPSHNAASDGSFACLAEQAHSTVRAVSAHGQLGTSYPMPTESADVYVTTPQHFVAFWGGPVYWTGDSGRTWHKVAQLTVHDNGYLTGVFAGSRGFFVSIFGTDTYTTQDGGRTWYRYEFS
jgi:photosystem II stability/assembly factor-like uncharacterized protein